MCRIKARRVRVCVNEEKGYGEHLKDGRSLSKMSVRNQACIDTIQPLNKLHAFLRVAYISKRKRVSLLPPSATPVALIYPGNGIQRCDAKQPCTACLQLDGGSNCVYKWNRPKQRKDEKLPAVVQPFLLTFKCKPSPSDSSSLVTGEDASFSASICSSPEIESPSTPRASSPASPDESRCSGSDAPDRLNFPSPQNTSSLETQLISFRRDSPKPDRTGEIPTFSFQFSRLSSVPRPLHLSFALLNPERFQISGTTSSELDLSLCVFPFHEGSIPMGN